MSNYGRERVVIVEIDQPLCTRVYGDGLGSPTPASGCQAALSADEPRKCFNTRFTCQDPDNYNPSTLTLRFSGKQQELTRYYGRVLPSLMGYSVTPGLINLGGMDENTSALGQREVLSLTFEDHLHSDHLVDKYRLERRSGAASFGSPSETYNPFERGTFWGKWLARNPYNPGYPVRLYEGFMGDAIEDMVVRHYIIDRIDGPSEGEVKIVAKDAFTRLDDRKAVAPRASRGELGANINSGSSSAALSPSGIGDIDYTASGYVAINDELIGYTRTADSLASLSRGAFGTTAAAHVDEDLVQQVLVYSAAAVLDIVYELLTEYGGIDAEEIDLAQWQTQASEFTQLYSAVIAKPTPVRELIGELCQQAGFTIWHDPTTNLIKVLALRASSSVDTIDDASGIIEGSLSIRRQEERRASQIWVYYSQRNPLGDQKDPNNYRSRVVVVDPDAEDEEQYGTPKVWQIFSRWIPTSGRTSAIETGERILSIFRDPPTEAKLALDASKDEVLGLARFITLETSEVQDVTGAVADSNQYAITSIERRDARVHIVAQGMAFATLPATPGGSAGTELDPRTIFIDNDASNINLRTLHDSLYEAPTDGSPPLQVTFVVESGITISSSSTGSYAMRTGSWPGTVQLTLQNSGRIQGHGGDGGRGGDAPGGNGSAGQNGGPALLVERAMTLDNSNGEIFGGGGGGGGGGSMSSGALQLGGGGGGGGSGAGAGAGAQGGNGTFGNGSPGSDGSGNTAGSGGSGAGGAGSGGSGGGQGAAGSAGNPGTGGVINGSGGAAGSAGNWIVGIALTTITGSGSTAGPSS